MEVAAVCRMTPRVKTSVELMRLHRRPTKSATGAAPRAPKKVPADKMETIVADWDEVTVNWPWLFLYPVENKASQYGMARIPLIVPVSYLLWYSQ